MSLMYIYIFNLGIDKGETTYMIYLEELTYIEDLTLVVISYEIYETSLRRVS